MKSDSFSCGIDCEFRTKIAQFLWFRRATHPPPLANEIDVKRRPWLVGPCPSQPIAQGACVRQVSCTGEMSKGAQLRAQDAELLDCYYRPEHLIMQNLPVPPVCIRPSVEMETAAGR